MRRQQRPSSAANLREERVPGQVDVRSSFGRYNEKPQVARARLRASSAGAAQRLDCDPCPDVKYAGARNHEIFREDARSVLQPDLQQQAPTLEMDGRRRRRGSRAPLGEGVAPKGQEDLPLQVVGLGYGRPTRSSESVHSVMQASGNSSFQKERAEAVYESNRREPLGKAYVRGHVLPSSVAQPGFAFGTATASHPRHHSDQEGRDIINPPAAEVAEDPRIQELYARSHQAFKPGEQLKRQYDWPLHIQDDPHHAFGRPEGARSQDGAGVKSIFANEMGENGVAPPPSRMVPLRSEAWQQLTNSCVGGVPHSDELHRRTCDALPAPDGAFGVPSGAQDASRVTVGSLLRACSRPEDLLPDRDLGRCIKEGCRNITDDAERVYGKPSRPIYGAPTATTAAPRPAGFSFNPRPRPLLQQQQQKNDGVAALMTPDRFMVKGASSGEFTKPLSRDEVSAVLSSAGYDLKDKSFDKIWASAVGDCGLDGMRISNRTSLGAVVEAFAEHTAAAGA